MIPTVEEVRRMSIDARGTQRPPAPTSPPAQPAPAVPPAPARAHSSASKKPGATGGAWLVPVAIIVLIVALTLAGVLIIRGMRRAHPTSAPAPASVVSVSATDGGERL